MRFVDGYKPDIKSLIEQCKNDWGDDPVTNRENLIPYGIKPFDLALYGIDPVNGELIVVQGDRKNRKTTFVVNVLINIMTGKKPAEKPVTVVDTLESGMQPKRYRDALIANLASRYLMKKGHRPLFPCKICGTEKCRELRLSPEFLRYGTRSRTQVEVIEKAMDTISSWPLYIFGANPKEGSTRNLRASVAGNGQQSRWEYLIGEVGAKIFVSDHVQQYSFATDLTDYEKQIRSVAAMSDIVAKYNAVVFLLSQVSLTSLRENRINKERVTAAGGSKAAAEATVVFTTRYNETDGIATITLEESRKAQSFSIMLDVDPPSGVFYGEPRK